MLLVEDDTASRNALRFLLRRAGWDVEGVMTLAEAIHSVAANPPVAMVLDLMLPDGDGLEVLRRIRASGSKARVAVVSGVGDPDWLKRVEELKPDAILRKPIDVNALMRALGG